MHTSDLIDQFLFDPKARGLAHSTVVQYAWALNRLAVHCPEYPVDGFGLLPVLDDTSMSLESKRDLLKCIKTFFRWCGRHHGMPNPAESLDPIPRRRYLPRVLTPEEIERLIGAAESSRDRALLLVMLDCGARVGEVASIRRRDIGDDWLIVRGKVGARQVPISKAVRELLITLGQGDYMWLGQRGPLTKHGVQGVYKRMFQRAGITGPKASVHTLRHTFATLYLRSKGGIRQLQMIMGHSRIETTMIYTHLVGDDVLADHLVHSPARTLGLIDPADDCSAPGSTSDEAVPGLSNVPDDADQRGSTSVARAAAAPDTTLLHCRIPKELHRELRYLMVDDGNRFVHQVVRAVREYVSIQNHNDVYTMTETVDKLETTMLRCQVPSDLHAQLRYLMVAQETGLAAQVVRAVREYVDRRRR